MLRLGVRVRDDAGPRLEIGRPVAHDHRSERDARIHGAVRQRVEHGAAVRPATEALELRDELHRADLRRAADRSGREARSQDVEGRHLGPHLADHLGDEVGDMREPLDLHAARDVDGAGAAHARQVVAPEIDEHHMLRAVLLGRAEALDVSLGRLGRACDRAEACLAVLAGDETLGRRADEGEPVELEQEQVGRRVDAAEGAIDLERAGRRRTLRALRRHALEHVALHDVLLDRAHHLQVAGALGMAAQRARDAPRLTVPRDARLETTGDLLVVSGEDVGGAGAVVEADERLGDHEPALGEPVPVRGKLHGRLQRRDVVVRDVADDRQGERLRLVERHEPGARAHPRGTPEPAALDRLEQEARLAAPAQVQVRPERGDEIGVDGRPEHGHRTKKDPPRVFR